MKRRTLLLCGSAVIVAAAAGGAAQFVGLFPKHYPPTPYDDVLGRLRDREWAEKFGVQAMTADFQPAPAAARLRQLLGTGTIQAAALRDAAEGHVTEAAKWLVPESVALLALLAAKVATP
jgi:hypothetical protein